MTLLSDMLEHGQLQRRCAKEVEELHRLFVTWFRGSLPLSNLQADLQQRLEASFSHVAPNGQFLRGRNVLLGHLEDKYGCYSDRVFEIDIYNVTLLWTDGDKFLCTYEEWQSWEQEDNPEDPQDRENDENNHHHHNQQPLGSFNGSAASGVSHGEGPQQFGRLSTCLLERVAGTNGREDHFRWIHVHETWLDADAPTPMTEEGKPACLDDETILTGPQPSTVNENDGTAKKLSVLVLFGVQTLSRERLGHQDEAFTLLNANGIAMDGVDGADPAQSQRRDQLLELARNGNATSSSFQYPLFFVVETSTKQDNNTDTSEPNINYWGDWNRFEKSSKAGTLREDFGLDPDANAVKLANTEKAAVAASNDQAARSVPAPAEPAPEEEATEEEKAFALKIIGRAVKKKRQKEADKNGDNGDSQPPPPPEPSKDPNEVHFLKQSEGILFFEEEEEEEQEPPVAEEAPLEQEDVIPAGALVPNDVSSKRHVAPKLAKYGTPLMWENSLVGISIAGFNIGTGQGPMADENWYRVTGEALEEVAQSVSIPVPRRKICLPEQSFPTAHVAVEGHGVWLSWDVMDALKIWAQCHANIAVHSRIAWQGVNVLKAKDAVLWEQRRKHISEEKTAAIFHYDWTFSTPFCGTVEGGEWAELDESGMRVSLLTDQTVPILFFDEIVLFEDDLHDNGQVQYTVKLRVMPTCAYVLARLWLCVDGVVVRLRETRVLVDFFGLQPQIYRDVSWKECYWEKLASYDLPTDTKAWHMAGETPQWHEQVQRLPAVQPPKETILEHAVLIFGKNKTAAAASGDTTKITLV